jgi:hypothetical protein
MCYHFSAAANPAQTKQLNYNNFQGQALLFSTVLMLSKLLQYVIKRLCMLPGDQNELVTRRNALKTLHGGLVSSYLSAAYLLDSHS